MVAHDTLNVMKQINYFKCQHANTKLAEDIRKRDIRAPCASCELVINLQVRREVEYISVDQDGQDVRWQNQ